MSRRAAPTLADLVVIGLSPALIMLLVTSLVFFLIHVFYLGEHFWRLNFIMAMFVMGAVAVARISIDDGREYALLFAVPLGLVTAIATIRFVEYTGPLQGFNTLINISLIALIWWSADKLTWDSTVLDESRDASGEGLLQTVGLDKPGNDSPAPAAEPEATTSREQPPQSFWRRVVESRKRPHAPGVWVIYFSLAALPIFGFGNWFVKSDLASRRYAFQLLVVYVASALGLLLTTSFLGLRRYLRQRRLEMPAEMAVAWIGTGAIMIAALLLVCTIFPRRSSEYSLTQLPIFARSPSDLWTTQLAVGNEGQNDPQNADRTGKTQQESASDSSSDQTKASGRGRAGQPKQPTPNSDSKQTPQAENDNSGTEGSRGKQGKSQQSSGSKNEPTSPGKSQQTTSGGKTKSASDSQNSKQEESKFSNDNRKTNPVNQQETPPEKSPDENRSDQNSDDRNSRTSGAKSGDETNRKQAAKAENSAESKSVPPENQRQSSSSRDRSGNQSPSRFSPPNFGSTFGELLKLLYWAAIVLIVAWLTWRFRREIAAALQNFLRSLRELWETLFRRKSEDVAGDPIAAPTVVVPARPFSSFADPFRTGMADQQQPEEVIRYSFEAFEAWAREQGQPRLPKQTPLEFAMIVGRQQSNLARDAAVLAELYCRCAYSQDSLPRSHLEPLRRFWSQLGRW